MQVLFSLNLSPVFGQQGLLREGWKIGVCTHSVGQASLGSSPLANVAINENEAGAATAVFELLKAEGSLGKAEVVSQECVRAVIQ